MSLAMIAVMTWRSVDYSRSTSPRWELRRQLRLICAEGTPPAGAIRDPLSATSLPAARGTLARSKPCTAQVSFSDCSRGVALGLMDHVVSKSRVGATRPTEARIAAEGSVMTHASTIGSISPQLVTGL